VIERGYFIGCKHSEEGQSWNQLSKCVLSSTAAGLWPQMCGSHLGHGIPSCHPQKYRDEIHRLTPFGRELCVCVCVCVLLEIKAKASGMLDQRYASSLRKTF
jgi:hypothetical protein